VSEDVPAYDSRIQRFNRTNISMHDFEHAMKFMDAAAEHGTESPEYEALFMAAIVLYARPFSSNEKGSAMASTRLHLDPAAILGNQHELHVQIIDRRNKAVAHAEWNYYPTSQIPVTPNASGFATSSKRWHPVNDGISPSDFRDIANRMRQACLDALFHDRQTAVGHPLI
jgi:hypothetical protein